MSSSATMAYRRQIDSVLCSVNFMATNRGTELEEALARVAQSHPGLRRGVVREEYALPPGEFEATVSTYFSSLAALTVIAFSSLGAKCAMILAHACSRRLADFSFRGA